MCLMSLFTTLCHENFKCRQGSSLAAARAAATTIAVLKLRLALLTQVLPSTSHQENNTTRRITDAVKDAPAAARAAAMAEAVMNVRLTPLTEPLPSSGSTPRPVALRVVRLSAVRLRPGRPREVALSGVPLAVVRKFVPLRLNTLVPPAVYAERIYRM